MESGKVLVSSPEWEYFLSSKSKETLKNDTYIHTGIIWTGIIWKKKSNIMILIS